MKTVIEILDSHKLWLENNPKGKRADLSGMNLSGMNLSYADLKGADLTNAKLNRTAMISTNLYRANLTNAELIYTNLSCATLKNAIFIGATLDNVIIYGAYGHYSFVAYDTSKRTVHCIKHDDTWMVKAGCFWGTLEALETRVKNTHNSKVYLSNIELLKGL